MEPRKSFAENGGFMANESVNTRISQNRPVECRLTPKSFEIITSNIQDILVFMDENGEHINAN
jgi:hypothetical protein